MASAMELSLLNPTMHHHGIASKTASHLPVVPSRRASSGAVRFRVRASAAAPPAPATKPGSPKKRGKTEVSESLLTPRFYTTDFDEMEQTRCGTSMPRSTSSLARTSSTRCCRSSRRTTTRHTSSATPSSRRPPTRCRARSARSSSSSSSAPAPQSSPASSSTRSSAEGSRFVCRRSRRHDHLVAVQRQDQQCRRPPGTPDPSGTTAMATSGQIHPLKIPDAVVTLAQAAAKANGYTEKYLPGWPLFSPPKMQLTKCGKCPREFCSSIVLITVG